MHSLSQKIHLHAQPLHQHAALQTRWAWRKHRGSAYALCNVMPITHTQADIRVGLGRGGTCFAAWRGPHTRRQHQLRARRACHAFLYADGHRWTCWRLQHLWAFAARSCLPSISSITRRRHRHALCAPRGAARLGRATATPQGGGKEEKLTRARAAIFISREHPLLPDLLTPTRLSGRTAGYDETKGRRRRLHGRTCRVTTVCRAGMRERQDAAAFGMKNGTIGAAFGASVERANGNSWHASYKTAEPPAGGNYHFLTTNALRV